jgi:D-alanyl-D-alanine carboxypeptidase
MKNVFIAVIAVLLVGSGALANYGYKKNEVLKNTQANLASTTLSYDMKIEELNKEKAEIEENYRKEKRKNDKFEEDIEDIEDAVSDLEKLKKLDKELLQKYSKVYFLNEHYVPKRIETIDKQYVLADRNPQLFHSDAMEYLEEMFDDAKQDGIELRVVSSYRSFTTQGIVKANHKLIYGSGANQFSADQGYSEHQLGTTMDISTARLGANFEKIDTDPAYTWLTENAYKYGFILSYPKNNKYYIFEPWHWRFVGTDLARDLHKDGKNFYDADQREIDSYLLHIFD